MRLAGAPDNNTCVHEPTVGTGGILRAIATAMRATGRDPGTVTWVGADTDPVAIGSASVNAVLWGLGHKVLLGVADTLTDHWITRAAAQRRQCLNLARDVQATTAILAVLDPTGTTHTTTR